MCCSRTWDVAIASRRPKQWRQEAADTNRYIRVAAFGTGVGLLRPTWPTSTALSATSDSSIIACNLRLCLCSASLAYYQQRSPLTFPHTGRLSAVCDGGALPDPGRHRD